MRLKRFLKMKGDLKGYEKIPPTAYTFTLIYSYIRFHRCKYDIYLSSLRYTIVIIKIKVMFKIPVDDTVK